jgi:hypothetical protein
MLIVLKMDYKRMWININKVDTQICNPTENAKPTEYAPLQQKAELSKVSFVSKL